MGADSAFTQALADSVLTLRQGPLAEYKRLLATPSGRALSPVQRSFLLAVLNLPPVPSGDFKTREQLVQFFLKSGVRVHNFDGTNLDETDLWRLVRASRAASNAFHIPPAVLMCLTFHESSFNRTASAWTTSAKGVVQLTNGAVSDAASMIRKNPEVRKAAQAYAQELGAQIPDSITGAPDVDALTRQIERLRADGAPAADIRKKILERNKSISSHKDEAGHIYNLETNFGLAAIYLSGLRGRLEDVSDERKGWLTAVAAYNQGLGYAKKLIKIFGGPDGYNAQSLGGIFNADTAAKLNLSADRQEEMLGEVGAVRACAIPE